MLKPYEFYEAARISQMLGGSPAVIQPITITENGPYEAPVGTDGYNPVNVAVPDRYDEGYTDGEEAVKAKIQSKTITANGTYFASADGLDGFDPVVVDVPDRYDEGYADGVANGEYVFPDGTNYEDIYSSVGGDTVIDKTVGYGVASRTEIDPNDPTRENVSVIVVNSVGEKVTGLYGIGAPAKDDWRVDNIHVYNTGHVDMIFSYLSPYDGTRQTSEHSAFSVYLVGFGANGNEIAVRK